MPRQYSCAIHRCYDCPHSSNNVIDHDDAFTSTPSSVSWYCGAVPHRHVYLESTTVYTGPPPTSCPLPEVQEQVVAAPEPVNTIEDVLGQLSRYQSRRWCDTPKCLIQGCCARAAVEKAGFTRDDWMNWRIHQ